MFDLACIFTTSGVMLFYKTFCSINFNIINNFIQNILLSEKGGETKYIEKPYVVKWQRENQKKLIFTVVYQEAFQLQCVDDFLSYLKEEFLKSIFPNIIMENNLFKTIPKFDSQFEKVIFSWQQKQSQQKKKEAVMRQFGQTSKTQKIQEQISQRDKKNPKKQKNKDKDKDKDKPENIQSPISDNNQNDNENAQQLENRKAFLERKFGNKNNISKSAVITNNSEQTKIQKKKTIHDINEKVSKVDMDELDVCKTLKGDSPKKQTQSQLLQEDDKEIEGFYDSDEEIEYEKNKNTQQQTSKFGFLSNISNSIKSITGNKNIEESDILAILVKIKEKLMTQNVAEPIAEKLCNSIKASLLDQKTKAFSSIEKLVVNSMKETLTKILTPKNQINLISEVLKSRELNKPYVMVFIGVNGVGKSTNLAKVANFFKREKFSVLLAACDNFRAGAVEQIKKHGQNLGLPVYDRGYKDNPATIAKMAIREATLKKIDVVLIDTAGRMQDNEPLMKALSTLIVVNDPDKVIFIGEALVGNDGVDQLQKFNRSLIDLSPSNNAKEIDGIILSKFDTVDNKVGAALSMTYTTGKPIYFVGVGQKYQHLKKLNATTVVNALLS